MMMKFTQVRIVVAGIILCLFIGCGNRGTAIVGTWRDTAWDAAMKRNPRLSAEKREKMSTQLMLRADGSGALTMGGTPEKDSQTIPITYTLSEKTVKIKGLSDQAVNAVLSEDKTKIDLMGIVFVKQ